ncbi:MAG: hypothetical protein LBP83_06905 [Dysgonamonadaceae bacterium]|jgi:hypothetical protein|nr:hypothetical protein [Dysgonamonadaceae bacterium]
MKSKITYPCFILILILSVCRTFAQTCNQDFTVTATPTPSTCQSNGTITVTLNGNTTNLINIQYGLSAVSGDFFIAPQSNNVLTGIPSGNYDLTVRAFCSIDANYDVMKTITNVTVGGNYQVPIATFAAGDSRKSYDNCATGIIVLNVTRGSGTFTFHIVSAPAGVSLGTVTATKSGNNYTLAGSNYPAGNYTMEVNDGCYTASVQFTLGSISGYPTLSTGQTVFRPVSNNPSCNLLTWNSGTVSNSNADYYRYYTDGMYEVSLSNGTPVTWKTWNSGSLSMDLGSYTYADFYTSNSLKAHLRVKGCSTYQTFTTNLKKPTYHTGTGYTDYTGCNAYSYRFIPWTDYDGMWCYPIDYEVKKSSDNSTVWSSMDRAYGQVTVPNLEYGVAYTLTTTDNQGTTLSTAISSRNLPSPHAYVDACNTYNYKYNFSMCYPLTVTITHPTAGVVHTNTVTSSGSQPSAGVNLDYDVNYTLTATSTSENFTYSATISRSRPVPEFSYTNNNCDYNFKYKFPVCYPLSVTITHPTAGVIHTATVTTNSNLPSAGINLDYNVNYTLTATNTSENFTYSTTITRSRTVYAHTLTLNSASNCLENKGTLRAYTGSSSYYFPVGTNLTVTGPAGYSTQTAITTSSSYYYNFPETTLPAGIYTLTIDYGCGSPLTATLNFPGAYDGSELSYSSAEDCNVTITPSGRVKYQGSYTTTYYRLTSGPEGYDKNTVLAPGGGSFILSQSGVYKLGIMTTNSVVGCVLREVTINYVPQPLQLNTAVTSAYVCNGESIGNIKIAAQNGKAPYTYQLWNAANTAKIAGVQDITASGAAHFTYGGPGDTYTIRVIDACGNMFSQAVQLIDLSTASIVYTGNTDNTVCASGSIQLRCVTLGTTTYFWEGPNGFTSNEQNPTLNNVTESMEGIYTVTVTPEYCGTALQQSITLTVNDLPTLPTVGNPTISYCQNASSMSLVSATGAAASTGNTLKWYGSDGTTAIIPPATISTSASGTTTYYVSQVNNTTGCESSKVTVTVTIISLPAPPSVNPVSTLCSGAAFSITVSSVVTGYYYKVYDASGTLLGSSAVGSGTIANLTAPSASTNYYVAAVNTDGCESSSRTSVAITVSPNVTPSVVISAGTTGFEICEDAVTQIALTATPTNGGTPSYVWKVNGAQVGTGTTYTLTNLKQYRPKATVSCEMTSTALCAVPATVTDEKNIRISSCVIPVNPHIRGRVAN